MEARETREYQRNMRRTAREMKEDTRGTKMACIIA